MEEKRYWFYAYCDIIVAHLQDMKKIKMICKTFSNIDCSTFTRYEENKNDLRKHFLISIGKRCLID